MNLLKIAIIGLVLPMFLTTFSSHVEAKKSIRFELTAEFIKTEYVYDKGAWKRAKAPTIHTTTRVLGDFGYEGSFDVNTGKYLVRKEWLDTQFNILNDLGAKVDLHPTVPKLTTAEYHFVQDDQDAGSFYYLDYQLDLLNNIEIFLLSEVGSTPLKFELTGEDVCNNIHFFAYKKGNETHYNETEINGCESSVLVITLEVDDWFWDGKPRVEAPYEVDFSATDKRKQIEIKNSGSGDLWIYGFEIYTPDLEPLYLFTVGHSTCTSGSIALDKVCTVEIVLDREEALREWRLNRKGALSFLRIKSNAVNYLRKVGLNFSNEIAESVSPIIYQLLLSQ